VELSAGPTVLINYHEEVLTYYRMFGKQNISVDMIGVNDDLSSYQLVIAPLLYMCKNGYDEKIRTYVKAGGVFITSYFSGIVDDNDLVVTGGYPGRLRDILGIWVEESDAIPKGESNSFTYKDKKYSATILCDLLHLEGAEALSRYEEDFYQGMPVVTCNRFGDGKAYYVATRGEEEFYDSFLGGICHDLKIYPVQKTPVCVEATLRENENGKFLFLLNHGEGMETVNLERGGADLITGKVYAAGDGLTLEKKDVTILKLD
jgi:beta-galactosidase